jgi:hypothetical protein
LLLGLGPGAALADGDVVLEIRPHADTANYTVELVEVKKNADGTTSDVPVKDRDGTPIKARMDKLRNLAKPPTDENPDGGRISESDKDRRKEQIRITLPQGTYKFRFVNDKTGETSESGKFWVPEGAGSGRGSNRISPIKLTMSSRPASLYIPEGNRVAQAETPGLEPGQEYASALGSGFELALTPGATFASIGTRQETSFPSEESGHSIDYGAANLHGDVRYYAADLVGVGAWRPTLLFGLKGSGTFGGADQGLEKDNHPPGDELDSFVKYEIDGSLTPYLGVVLAEFDCSRVNLLLGPRITFAEITGITDEGGGGGELEEFDRDVVQVGPAFGVELDVPISRVSGDGFEGGLRVAGWGEYLPGVGVSGDSSSFPFDYRFETKGAFAFTMRAGVFVRFGGPRPPPPPPPPPPAP